jgi:hypothetical protein
MSIAGVHTGLSTTGGRAGSDLPAIDHCGQASRLSELHPTPLGTPTAAVTLRIFLRHVQPR